MMNIVIIIRNIIKILFYVGYKFILILYHKILDTLKIIIFYLLLNYNIIILTF